MRQNIAGGATHAYQFCVNFAPKFNIRAAEYRICCNMSELLSL